LAAFTANLALGVKRQAPGTITNTQPARKTADKVYTQKLEKLP
jgi:hypothetical protein